MTFAEAIDYLLDEFKLGEKYDDVKERQDYTDHPGISWIDHPDSKRFAAALNAIEVGRASLRANGGEMSFKGAAIVPDSEEPEEFGAEDALLLTGDRTGLVRRIKTLERELLSLTLDTVLEVAKRVERIERWAGMKEE